MNIDQPIATIMTKDVVCVEPSQKLIDVKHIFEKRNFHHHIPVVEANQLKGMVSLIDFMRAIGKASLNDSDEVYHKLTVKDIMSRELFTKPSTASIREVSTVLAKGDVHAIVIADNGKLSGIVSTADVIRFFLN